MWKRSCLWNEWKFTVRRLFLSVHHNYLLTYLLIQRTCCQPRVFRNSSLKLRRRQIAVSATDSSEFYMQLCTIFLSPTLDFVDSGFLITVYSYPSWLTRYCEVVGCSVKVKRCGEILWTLCWGSSGMGIARGVPGVVWPLIRKMKNFEQAWAKK